MYRLPFAVQIVDCAIRQWQLSGADRFVGNLLNKLTSDDRGALVTGLVGLGLLVGPGPEDLVESSGAWFGVLSGRLVRALVGRLVVPTYAEWLADMNRPERRALDVGLLHNVKTKPNKALKRRKK